MIEKANNTDKKDKK